jgi:twitching motility two-component system response regulator PilH
MGCTERTTERPAGHPIAMILAITRAFLNQPMSTVLVVEDSLPQREMITELLRGIGLTVTVASDGMEALEQMQSQRPDMVVLDIVMPRMNGYELCRRIKADPSTQNVPVVMCSSKGEEFDRYWGVKQGADAYIAKPFQPIELVGTVKQLLRG